MPTARIIWQGKPGEVHTNDTGRFQYQMVCDLVHTCGTCLQYHLAISNWWPIPFHRNCRCSQRPIRPGQNSKPFENFRDILDKLDEHQKTEAIGKSNYKLLKSGVVDWQDIVTETRVRSLKEVVAARKLDLTKMVGAGVSEGIAVDALKAVHTPEQIIIRQERKVLVERLQGAGFSRDQIVKGVAAEIHKGVSIGAGPSKSNKIPPPSGGKLPGDIIAAFNKFQTGPPKPGPKPTPAPSPAPPPTPRSKAERLKVSADWRDTLTQAEKDAVRVYVGHGFEPINAYLRTGEIPPLYRGHEDKLRGIVASLDSAMEKAVLDRDLTLWRGVRDLEAMGLDPANLVGAVIGDKGFLSTSMSRGSATTFVRDQPGGAVFRIVATKGSKGGYVGDLAMLDTEQEVLFHRNSKLTISGAKREKGMLIIDVELSGE